MKNLNDDQASFLADCRDLANCTSIPDILAEQIQHQGFAGPANNPKLTFLALYSGMLKRPVSLVYKGASGAGKSYSVKMGKQFVPEVAYEEFSGMSDKALIYLNGLNLTHKHLIIGEAAGMAEGNGRTFLRQLLSEHEVRYVTVQSTSQGLKGEILPALKGPCGLIVTTTATGIHHEDETRMLSINMPESSELIAQALMAQASGNQGAVYEIDKKPWFALYDFVNAGTKNVSIPFASDVARNLPTSHERIKRDFAQVLSLISASALMHSCRRDWDEEGRVIASEADYELVYDLVDQPLSEGLQVTEPEALRALINAVEELEGAGGAVQYGRGISQSQLAEKLQRDNSSVSRQVFRAVKEGYLEDLNPGQGRSSRLVLGARRLSQGRVLPAPKQLFERDVTA